MQNKFTIPTYHRQYTLRAIAYGAVLLIWLSLEDATVWVVSLLGAGLALMSIGLMIMRWFGGRQLTLHQWAVGLVLVGMIIGFGAIWGTVTLMIFKNAWHAHAAPDFPSEVVVGIVERWRAWTFAGGLMGGAMALLPFFRHAD